ncbi:MULTISPECIES: hypothetical protein [unclassified Endozoicomonas]|uniref:hypothetical protein n=1 Tax=unclassified Endozoicomonas TaxID=2644528 RepID=UPI003BB6ED9B
MFLGAINILLPAQSEWSFCPLLTLCRVSSIDTQKSLLLKKHPDSEFIGDIASAFNFKREGLQTILESAMLGNPTLVVVTTKDRLARSGLY